MKFIVTAIVQDMRSGGRVAVPFFTDTAMRADLLRAALLTGMHRTGGVIDSYGIDNSAMRLTDVTPPAELSSRNRGYDNGD